MRIHSYIGSDHMVELESRSSCSASPSDYAIGTSVTTLVSCQQSLTGQGTNDDEWKNGDFIHENVFNMMPEGDNLE